MARIIGINGGEFSRGWKRTGEIEVFCENTVMITEGDEVTASALLSDEINVTIGEECNL